MGQTINLDEWYSPTEAAKRLTINSGKEIQVNYVRTLAKYGKIRFLRLSSRSSLYFKADIDSYVVEDRGEKAARVRRQRKAEGKKPYKAQFQPSDNEN